MRIHGMACSVLVLFGASSHANATVSVAIDLSRQRMHVESAEGNYDWPISSARTGFSTPGGSYAPIRLELMHYSRKYHMSPMPHAIFFRGGYAIHGTYSTGSLGRPASHGCVRLSPGNAAALYSMVQHEGARISISGTPPSSRPFAETRYARVYERSTDADALSRLAPPSDESTADQSYGDAAFAQRRARRVHYGYGYEDAAGYGYRYTPQRPYGYRPGYTYAPAYLSAPQIVFGDRYQQTPLIPGLDE